MAKLLSLKVGDWANSGLMGMDAMYLTTGDSALEFGLTNTYKMYENFTVTPGSRLHRIVASIQTSPPGARAIA